MNRPPLLFAPSNRGFTFTADDGNRRESGMFYGTPRVWAFSTVEEAADWLTANYSTTDEALNPPAAVACDTCPVRK